jgi:hypothetical protein
LPPLNTRCENASMAKAPMSWVYRFC